MLPVKTIHVDVNVKNQCF